jgi:isoamylase
VVIDYLQQLGVSAIELMPVHQFIHDAHLVERGLRNYWGYNSIGFLAPHNEYGSGQAGEQVTDFKRMVRALHEAQIEVILDVVYNHTAEGNHLGPTLSFKGLDNAAYYRLMPDDKRHYMDYTGTGNSLNMRNPHVLQLIMDSLRYWITEMHVDGFRFDLASALARELHAVDRLSAFFDLIQQDPVVRQVKLIAEPWDVGEGGYQVGNFPPGWSEWNGRYRDAVRDYWRGAEQTLGEFANRLSGSSDLYEGSGRAPHASINFVTAHDGFTLRDLVSYDHKHNEANGEDNRDGTNDNRSWNHGAEGPTDDPEVLALRARAQRTFLATLFLSQGTPMLLGGDEFGRTQGGNNNGYCQDNEISWYDWTGADQALLAFSKALIALRRAHPVFRRRRWFEGEVRGARANPDIGWFNPDGNEMTDADWQADFARSVGVFLNGEQIGMVDERGEPISDASFYLLLNAHHEPLRFTLPAERWGGRWVCLVDTDAGYAVAEPPDDATVTVAGTELNVPARTLMLLRRVD